jgi:PIN domain nuclease of toxin-antitoxin system
VKLFLLDTQLVIWSGMNPGLLSKAAREQMGDPQSQLYFSSVSIWEIAIKQALGRSGFHADARFARDQMLAIGYKEVPLTGEHAIAIERLPMLHGDPFDRVLIAQAMCEGLTLLTADAVLGKYPGPILVV